MSQERKKVKGFTIIEVVLVLAIAGLIFLMVFIALPALQRSQRDTQRKNDLSRAQTALVTYTSNNRGSLPANTAAAWQAFLVQYLTPNTSDTFIDPLGASPTQAGVTAYVFTPRTVAAGVLPPLAGAAYSTVQNIIYFTDSATCGNTGDAVVAAGNRKVALRMYLEGGGITCINN